jgi:hypothetical protein
MGINTLRFSNYEEGAPNRSGRSEKTVCCRHPDPTNSYGDKYDTREE